MKRFTLLCLSLMAAIVMLATDKNGRFFLRFQGQEVPVLNVVDNFGQWLDLPQGTEWREVSRATDYTGMDRIVYRQYVDGVEVEHSQVIVHAKDGLVRSANGTVMEARRTPAKVRKAMDKDAGTRASRGEGLLLINTSDGYRYAYKILDIVKKEWVYYDAETDQVIKRVATRHTLDLPEGTPATVTGKSFYSGDVQIDAYKGNDGLTYLYDPARNIHTLNAAYLKKYSQLIEDHTLFDYFPQGNLPDDPSDVDLLDMLDWRKEIMELMDVNGVEHFTDYVKDFTTYVTSPDGNFSAYQINTVNVTKLTGEDEDGTLVPITPDDIDEEMAYDVVFNLRYGNDTTNISLGLIDNLTIPLKSFDKPLNITELGEVIPKEGMTLIVKIAPGDDDDEDEDEDEEFDEDFGKKKILSLNAYDDDDDDDDYNYGDDDDDDDDYNYGDDEETIAICSFVPDESGIFRFENDRIAFSFTYQPAGDPTIDIHWGMGKTLDFYKEVFGRNSFDGKGSPVYNLAYLPEEESDSPLGFDNCNAAALTSQEPYPMIYGMGGVGMISLRPVVELTVMAHEFTHIVTGMTANLEYQGESGALNESFSDIMGISVKKYNKNTADWYIGDGVAIGFSNMRDMADPKNSMDGEQPAPDTYMGEYWVDADDDGDGDNGGVHTNSSVQNKWYQLLTDGGSGTNDNDYKYDMQGIGIEKAQQIAYLTLTSYASEQTNYPEISEASIEAANVLYGENGIEANAVIDAWKAVGVLAPDYYSGIQSVAFAETAGNGYYDLQGRQVSNPVKGIYIKDGRKVVIK